MEKLFTPDFGLMVWTVVTFLLLLAILGKFGWKPLIQAIEDREAGMKREFDGAQEARAQSERIKKDLEARMADLEAQGREILARAVKEGENLRTDLKTAAEADARKIKEKALAELADEKNRLVRELRGEVARLSVFAAEKLLRRSVDGDVQKTVLDSFFHDLDERRSN